MEHHEIKLYGGEGFETKCKSLFAKGLIIDLFLQLKGLPAKNIKTFTCRPTEIMGQQGIMASTLNQLQPTQLRSLERSTQLMELFVCLFVGLVFVFTKIKHFFSLSLDQMAKDRL